MGLSWDIGPEEAEHQQLDNSPITKYIWNCYRWDSTKRTSSCPLEQTQLFQMKSKANPRRCTCAACHCLFKRLNRLWNEHLAFKQIFCNNLRFHTLLSSYFQIQISVSYISCHIQIISNNILHDFSCIKILWLPPFPSKEFQASFLTLATLSDIFTHPCARSPNCICRLSFHMMFRLCRAYSHLQGVHGSATRCSHGLHLSCHEEK